MRYLGKIVLRIVCKCMWRNGVGREQNFQNKKASILKEFHRLPFYAYMIKICFHLNLFLHRRLPKQEPERIIIKLKTHLHRLHRNGVANVVHLAASRVVLARLALNIRRESLALILIVGQAIVAIGLGVVRDVINTARAWAEMVKQGVKSYNYLLLSKLRCGV